MGVVLLTPVARVRGAAKPVVDKVVPTAESSG